MKNWIKKEYQHAILIRRYSIFFEMILISRKWILTQIVGFKDIGNLRFFEGRRQWFSKYLISGAWYWWWDKSD